MVKFRKYQKDTLRKTDKFDGRALYALDMGLGKAQPNDSIVIGHTGPRRMGEIEVGEFIMGTNGLKTKVTGVYPQGRQKVYRVTFADGSRTECTLDHLWKVNTPERHRKGKPFKVLSLRTIKNSKNKYFIPYTKPPEHSWSRDIHSSPNAYLLGMLLAHGNITKEGHLVLGVTDKRALLWTKMEAKRRVIIKRKGGKTRVIGKDAQGMQFLQKELKQYGVIQNGKIVRRIPDAYLYESVGSRIHLAGGMLTKGTTVSKKGGIEWTTPYCNLAAEMVLLIQSLGGIARQKKHDDGNYVVQIEFFKHRVPMANVLLRCAFNDGKYVAPKNAHLRRMIKKIEYVGKKRCTCIKVDAGNQLYLTNNYIVTHNTLVSLKWAHKRKKTPGVIVCPASVKWQWQNEAYKHFKFTSLVLEGMSPKGKQSIDPTEYDLLIINYDILQGWVGWIKRYFKPRIIILDEVHYVKNKDAKRTKAVQMLCKKRKHILALSGTPLTNRPVELWPILNILRPDKYSSFVYFTKNFCQRRRTRYGWQYTGAKNLTKLNRRLKQHCMIRYRKEDVLDELPSKKRNVVVLDIIKRLEYKVAERNLAKWLRQRGRYSRGRSKGTEERTRMMLLRQLAAELKMKYVLEWIDTYLQDSNGKIVIFAWHKKIVSLIRQRYNCAVITGETPSSLRGSEISKFKHNRKCRIFLGNIKAAGTGVDGLQTVASDVVFVEFPWSPADLEQATDRVHRYGQKNKVQVHYLVARDTIEHRLISMLQQKKGILDETLDGMKKTNMAIFDQLVNELRKVH